MFSIKFLKKKNKYSSATIEINNFKEDLDIPLFYWNEDNYKRQWIFEIEKLLNNKNGKFTLLVSMYKPDTINFLMTWVLYREEDNVFIHNSMLFLDKTSNFDVKEVDKYSSDRETVDEDGNKVSEWKTTVDDLRLWLKELKQEVK